MSATELARAIGQWETSASLLEKVAEDTIANRNDFDAAFDAEWYLQTAREMRFKALRLRVLLEVEKRERVLH